ncbi:hypothetical protein F2P81_013313 [Scophthalmus maximus]|uniref:Uncharacterized protein n=1 Tax=Scophthalmus maximus TaxID=52904 RepID=A0A6A4SSG9_SCOMX|nr:hypothetical protein F2P81_013313 [Scophthalmus maximus]
MCKHFLWQRAKSKSGPMCVSTHLRLERPKDTLARLNSGERFLQPRAFSEPEHEDEQEQEEAVYLSSPHFNTGLAGVEPPQGKGRRTFLQEETHELVDVRLISSQHFPSAAARGKHNREKVSVSCVLVFQQLVHSRRDDGRWRVKLRIAHRNPERFIMH